MTTISLATPWNVLLDIASDGGLEANIVLSSGGYGFLTFDICTDEINSDALKAARAAAKLFDLGGATCHEMFAHCFTVGSVSREHSLDEPILFKGPLNGLALRALNGQPVGLIQ